MKNPVKNKKDSAQVYRGGSWGWDLSRLRVSYRNGIVPTLRRDDRGFRIVRNESQNPKK